MSIDSRVSHIHTRNFVLTREFCKSVSDYNDHNSNFKLCINSAERQIRYTNACMQCNGNAYSFITICYHVSILQNIGSKRGAPYTNVIIMTMPIIIA